MNLTPKQKRFCQEYVIDLNGTQAAIRAGYSEKTAASIASEYLIKPNIQTYVKVLQAAIAERTNITADMVVQELAKIGFANLQDYIKGDNDIRDLSTIERKHAAGVESVKTITRRYGKGDDATIETTVQLKLHDKVSALEKIGRHLGIFEKDNQQQKPETSVTFNETIISKKV